MTSNADILIATSIAPHTRLSEQSAAIASWQDHGFRVASLNAPNEIAALEPDFPGVAFESVERTAHLLTGRQHVFIDDILRYLATSGTEIVGIVNSDIVLEPIPDLVSRLSGYAGDGLVCCPRLDVHAAKDTTGQIDPFGYDLFFFPSSATKLWGPTRLCLGQGYWDHYLPLMAILRNYPTVKLLPPIGRHVSHETKRDDSFFIFADEFAALATGFMAGAYPAEMDWQRFGQGFPKHRYAESRRLAEAGTNDGIEAFARHIDALTRYVIQFIDRNARRVSLSA